MLTTVVRPTSRTRGPGRLTRIVVCATALTSAWSESRALAQEPVDSRGADPAQAEEAQGAFDAGVEAAQGDRWVEALEHFQRAYELLPDPQLLVNMATAQAHLGHLIDARQSYLRALNELPEEDEELRRLTDQGINSVERRIPEVRLELEGIGVRDVVWIDDEVVMDLRRPRLLDPGEHALTVRREGQPLARMRFALAEGERRTLSLAVGPARIEREGGEEEDSLVDNPWLWVGIGAGVVLLTAVVAVVVALTGADDPAMGSGPRPFSGNLMPGTLVLE